MLPFFRTVVRRGLVCVVVVVKSVEVKCCFPIHCWPSVLNTGDIQLKHLLKLHRLEIVCYAHYSLFLVRYESK